MFILTDQMIENLASNSEVYARGVVYYLKGQVLSFHFSNQDLCAVAAVQGSELYDVRICFSEAGEIVDAHCECPAFYQYDGACKHMVAVLKFCQSHLSGAALPKYAGNKDRAAGSKPGNNNLTRSILQYFEYSGDSLKKCPIDLEVTFELDNKLCWYNTWETTRALSLRTGKDKLYVVRNMRKFLQAMESGETLVFGKGFEYSPHLHYFQPRHQQVIDLLREMYEVEKKIAEANPYGWNAGGSIFKGKQAFLTKSAIKKLLSIPDLGGLKLKLFDEEYHDVRVVKEDLPLSFTLDKQGNDLLLQWKALKLVPLTQSGEFFFYDGKIYHISQRQRLCFIPLLNAFLKSPRGIQFSGEEREGLVVDVLPELKESARVEVSPAVQESLFQPGLKGRVYLDRDGEAITARVDFIYGKIKVNPFAGNQAVNTGDKTLVRDKKTERKILGLLEQADFRTLNGYLYLHEEEKIFDFVHFILPDLQKIAEVYYSKGFKNFKVRSASSFSGGVRLSEETGMLELSFQVDDIDMEELGRVLEALREKKRYHRLKDGSFLPLDGVDSTLARAAEMIDALGISKRELKKQTLQVPKYRALYIDSCLKDRNLPLERDRAFKRLVQNINRPADTGFEVPESLKGVLRDYQKTGYKWLKTLAAYGLGGILADDMGLGKTLQTLAFILSERERAAAPALVVAPTSVVYNWQEEAGQFAPELKTVVVSGTPKEREALIKEAREADLVITSYALMRKDIERYQDIDFGYCFLDEAQHIKNPGSLSARAVKTLKARGRFALTGTPLENSLTELWSIFDFVMPGYLFSHQKFSKKYERPIIKNQNRQALEELQKQIAPFILRRMKKEVLKELPPKTETRMLTDLTREQKKVYLAYWYRAKGEIEEALATRGFEKSRIQILTALTRLRQICCHPGTFLEDYRGDSGKLQSLKELVQDTLAGGHRILLFSQFTGMLSIIRNHLEQEGISYFYLDGSTRTEERGKLVQAFNGGEADVFLISLKAGGTGLNLTGADTVIHYDPWWNPAVEEQAADRAYRIGQENPVQVINLITRDTIEEKIYELQQKKRAMIDSVISPGETMLSRMTEQEVRELFAVG